MGWVAAVRVRWWTDLVRKYRRGLGPGWGEGCPFIVSFPIEFIIVGLENQ